MVGRSGGIRKYIDGKIVYSVKRQVRRSEKLGIPTLIRSILSA